MLPFDQRTWAPQLAMAVIAITLLGEVIAIQILRSYGPLDTAEITALVLILIAVVPPNIHIIRRKSHPHLPLQKTNTIR
ncbi:hypothetical protein [Granulicella sibirica]|uniref:Uncharacterized protein n=1 Tax=Granulicella sibirica TaxID=2479048 RepID=A0A4Q0T5N9_9BACT|nr:hypothetical protein [Granulicella sibirica]RXH58727.1 hypothetical protein GRAN_2037 [Granulicella sibirica]